MGILTSIFGFLLANPMVILGFLGVFAMSGVYSEVKGWYRERQIVKPWVAAVKDRDAAIQERDNAVIVKEAIVVEAIKARENSKHEVAQLQAQLEAAEIERKAAKAPDCNFSADDVRMLNRGRNPDKKPPAR